MSKVAYKGIRAFSPKFEDLNLAVQNLAGLESNLLRLKSLGYRSGLTYDDAEIEYDEALQYVDDIRRALRI